MALLINKDVSILGELSSSQIYIRLNLKYDYEGKSLIVETKNYISKNSYLNSDPLNHFRINGISPLSTFDYNNIDGNLLVAAHTKLKDYLSTDILEELITYDPSTGDPSIGYEIKYPKFCDESEIQIIDISIN